MKARKRVYVYRDSRVIMEIRRAEIMEDTTVRSLRLQKSHTDYKRAVAIVRDDGHAVKNVAPLINVQDFPSCAFYYTRARFLHTPIIPTRRCLVPTLHGYSETTHDL